MFQTNHVTQRINCLLISYIMNYKYLFKAVYLFLILLGMSSPMPHFCNTKSHGDPNSMSASDEEECSRSTLILSNKPSKGRQSTNAEQVIAEHQLKALKRRKKKKKESKTPLSPVLAPSSHSLLTEEPLKVNVCDRASPLETTSSASDSDCVRTTCTHTNSICSKGCMELLRGGSSMLGPVYPATSNDIFRDESGKRLPTLSTRGVSPTHEQTTCNYLWSSLVPKRKRLQCRHKHIRSPPRKTRMLDKIYFRRNHSQVNFTNIVSVSLMMQDN